MKIKKVLIPICLSLLTLLSSCENKENIKPELDLKTTLTTLKDSTSYELVIDTNYKVSSFGYTFNEGFIYNAKYDEIACEYTLYDSEAQKTLENFGYANYQNNVFRYTFEDGDLSADRIIDLDASITNTSRANITLFKDITVPPLLKDGETTYNLNVDNSSDMKLVQNFVKVSGLSYNSLKNDISNFVISINNNNLIFNSKIKEVYDLTVTVKSINETSLTEIREFLEDGNAPKEFNPLLMEAFDLSTNKSHIISFNETSTEGEDKAYINIDNETPYIYMDYFDNSLNETTGTIAYDFLLVPIYNKTSIDDDIYALPIIDNLCSIDLNNATEVSKYGVYHGLKDIDFTNKDSVITELKRALFWQDEIFGTLDTFYIDEYYFTFEGPEIDDAYPNDYVFSSYDTDLNSEITIAYMASFGEIIPSVGVLLDVVSKDGKNVDEIITQFNFYLESSGEIIYFNEILSNFDDLDAVSFDYIDKIISDTKSIA